LAYLAEYAKEGNPKNEEKQVPTPDEGKPQQKGNEVDERGYRREAGNYLSVHLER
jgi:hypothetical protein